MKHAKFASKVYSLLGFSTENIHLKLNYSAVVSILSSHILYYLSFGVHIHVALRVNCNNSGCFKMLSFVNSNMKKWNKK